MKDGWKPEDLRDFRDREDAIDEAEADEREERADAIADNRDLVSEYGIGRKRRTR